MRPRALRKTESFTLPVETERFREYCRSPSFLTRADSEIWESLHRKNRLPQGKFHKFIFCRATGIRPAGSLEKYRLASVMKTRFVVLSFIVNRFLLTNCNISCFFKKPELPAGWARGSVRRDCYIKDEIDRNGEKPAARMTAAA